MVKKKSVNKNVKNFDIFINVICALLLVYILISYFLGGVVQLLSGFGVSIPFFGSWSPSQYSQLIFDSIFTLLGGVILAFIIFNLFKREDWARVATILSMLWFIVSAVQNILYLLIFTSASIDFLFVLGIVEVIFDVAVIVFLLNKKVREAFR